MISYVDFKARLLEYERVTGYKYLVSSSTKLEKRDCSSDEMVYKRILFSCSHRKISGCVSRFWYKVCQGLIVFSGVNMNHNHCRTVVDIGKTYNRNMRVAYF